MAKVEVTTKELASEKEPGELCLLFSSNCVPNCQSLLSPDQHRSTLAERRRRIAERLNAFLDQTALHPPVV